MFARLENDSEMRKEIQSYRMEILSKCNGSNVHIINNKLGVILGALDLVLLHSNSGDRESFNRFAFMLKSNCTLIKKMTGVGFQTRKLLNVMKIVEKTTYEISNY